MINNLFNYCIYFLYKIGIINSKITVGILNNPMLLKSLCVNSKKESTQELALQKLTSEIIEKAADNDSGLYSIILSRSLKNEKILKEIVIESPNEMGIKALHALILPDYDGTSREINLHFPAILTSSYKEEKTSFSITDETISHYISSIKALDQDYIKKMALEANFSKVRETAVNVIDDQNILKKLAFQDKDANVRLKAIEKIPDENLLLEFALKDAFLNNRLTIIEKNSNQEILETVALRDDNREVRLKAVGKIQSQETLGIVALKDDDREVRLRAVDKIQNRKILETVALQDDNREVRLQAIQKLRSLKPHLGELDYLSTGVEEESDKENVLDVLTEIILESNQEDLLLKTIHQLKSLNLTIEFLGRELLYNGYDSSFVFSQKDIDQNELKNKLTFSNKEAVRLAALKRISRDQKFLASIALTDSNLKIRKKAIDKISDQEILFKIVSEEPNFEVKLKAFKKITEPDKLKKLSKIMNEALLIDSNKLINALSDIDMPIPKPEDIKEISSLGVFELYEMIIDLVKDSSLWEIPGHWEESPYSNLRDDFSDLPTLLEDRWIEGHIDSDKLNAFLKKLPELVLKDIFLSKSISPEIREYALSSLYNQEILVAITSSSGIEIEKKWGHIILNKIEDDAVIKKIAMNEGVLQDIAITKLQDEGLLEQIALENNKYWIRGEAVKKLNNKKILLHILQNDTSNSVCNKVRDRLFQIN